MLPVFNANPFRSYQPNGPSSSTPQQQVMAPPNPMQMGGGGIFNPQLNQYIPNQTLNTNINFSASQQQLGQFLPQNSINPNHVFNQSVNMGVPNGQWNLHNMNMSLNANPFYTMGMPNLGQVPQGIGHQDLAYIASARLGLLNANQMANVGLQVQGNLGPVHGYGSVQAQQNQISFNQAQGQSNLGKVTNDNQRNGNWKKPHNNNFNQKHETSRNGPMKSNFHQRQNGKGNFRAPKDQRGNVRHQDLDPRKSALHPSKQNQAEKKRPIVLNYTDQEVQQWREQRKRNYPSKENMEKKLTQKLTVTEANDEAAKLRRQQLKEILAKQAELGCEVAEIPSSYLLDSEQQVHGMGEKRPFNKKERFQNKFNKRGNFHQNDHFSKRPRTGDAGSSNVYERNGQLTKKQILGNNKPTSDLSKREPTLLQKLLSADIRRDRHHLMQVFKFMAMNSFFKDLPREALNFPTVIVKDTGNEVEILEERGVIEGINKTGLKNSVDDNVSDGDNDGGVTLHHEKVGPRKQELQEEEGEIID